VDGLVIASGCKRPVRFVIDTMIYNLPVLHYLMTCNRAIPILPTRESVLHALDEIAEGLAAGDLICIFPEGQLTYTGSLGRFKTGIESIIKRSPVPIYPIALNGLWGSMFSRKYYGTPLRYLPGNPWQPVRALCGEPVPPEMVSINYLQRKIMQLKYQAQAGW
jgi:1-acyl-sn-glycerol-3-phosphate acyltransferase